VCKSFVHAIAMLFRPLQGFSIVPLQATLGAPVRSSGCIGAHLRGGIRGTRKSRSIECAAGEQGSTVVE
jgi:hypothetical protein